LQPEWRRGDDRLPRATYTCPDNKDWGVLCSSGKNGFLMVMMVFSWWGQGGEKDATWEAAIVDLRRALEGLVAVKRHTAQKRYVYFIISIFQYV